jgi:hypothetical protein
VSDHRPDPKQTTLASELDTARAALSERSRQLAALQAEMRALLIDAVRFRVRRHLAGKPGGKREDRHAALIRASGLFDEAWYRRHCPDAAVSPIDPVLHYLRQGAAEGRDPSLHFCGGAYRRRYPDVAAAGVNPLLHFLQYGIEENRTIDAVPGNAATPGGDWIDGEDVPGPGRDDGGLTAEHGKFVRRGDAYEDFDPGILKGVTLDVKVLAFYLPQFHAIPENDAFWGKGFTEWRQVARGLPRFPGHYQPRLPSDLGFYDLTDIAVMRRQVEMAQAAGIHGFGFYYYRFDDRRVLERPIENFLGASDIAMPFMLIWANENWTRTWDGQTGDLLLVQSYAEAAETALLADIARHFADPRYIRIGGRPFFVIYQPRHVPNAPQTFARWRRRWKDEFGVEPLIFMAQTFGAEDPTPFGLDGAMEFPPHKLSRGLPEREVADAFQSGFAARVLSYDDIVAASTAEPAPTYPLIKTAAPGWDNDPRRPMRGMIVEGSTPRKYQVWLARLIARARHNPVLGERLVAVNAWNEWAEGAYLEPDVHYGGAYLNATARAHLTSR